MTAYRYPTERIILIVTVTLVLAVIALTAAATLCGSVLFVVAMIGLSYTYTRSHHRALVKTAHPITPETAPGLAALVRNCSLRLGAKRVETFVIPANVMNAYTFGLAEPFGVVLYGKLVQAMDADELRFVIGHELGHVCLGHTWLNSLIGGMAGIPSPGVAAVILYFAFRWWNRACEYSADRAGLLACGKPQKAASALVKLVATGAGEDPGQALRRIEAEDDLWGNNLMELVATHPMTVRRLAALRDYATSARYQSLQEQIDGAHPLP